MPTSRKAFYYGAVLFEIAEDEHFTSINKIPNIASSSAYQLNHNMGIYIKHTETNQGGGQGGNCWKFTFSPEHQDVIRKMFAIYGEKTFLIFVCEDQGFCIVDFGVFATCLDFNHRESEWIEILRPDGGSFKIRGAQGDHPRSIPLNAFPRKLFE